MKRLLISCLIAMGALTATALPTYAQSVTITTDDGYGYRHYDPYYHYGDRYYGDRYRYRTMYRDSDDYRYGRCMTRRVAFHHYGRLVVRETRYCR
ncbi:hypothetical protein QD460_01720 [Rhizobium jaguaris]|uniref:hypothetical protein n=1 Tax=Rhizobium jaguaris TaxID=1312183 RepID=UPI0039BF13F1